MFCQFIKFTWELSHKDFHALCDDTRSRNVIHLHEKWNENYPIESLGRGSRNSKRVSQEMSLKLKRVLLIERIVQSHNSHRQIIIRCPSFWTESCHRRNIVIIGCRATILWNDWIINFKIIGIFVILFAKGQKRRDGPKLPRITFNQSYPTLTSCHIFKLKVIRILRNWCSIW